MGGGASLSEVTRSPFCVDEIIECDKCTEHLYLHKWEGVYACTDCGYRLNDTSAATEKNCERITKEQELERKTPCDESFENVSKGQMSAGRGVKIGFLLWFTNTYGCWEWNSHEIIRKIIKPATKSKRCRATELPEMKSFVGPASTFISYAQSGKWGDVVAAILDGGADHNRCVWLDIFAIRQWPSESPDLDFATTIENCTSFLSICSYQQEIVDMDYFDALARKTEKLPAEVRRKVNFMRVWCLVEAQKACSIEGMPFILKAGSHKLQEDGTVEFVSNSRMLYRLLHLVDIEKAEATVASDRERIIQGIVNGVGIGRLNSVISGALAASITALDRIPQGSAKEAQCAAYGDVVHLNRVLSNPLAIFALAACGFLTLLSELITSGVGKSNAITEQGRTALRFAAEGGHASCVRLLLAHGADANVKDQNGNHPLIYAAQWGHTECLEILITVGKSDLQMKNDSDETVLMFAARGGHTECLRLLLGHGDTEVDCKRFDSKTALMLAARGGHAACLTLLLEAGASVNAMTADDERMSALTNAAEGGHPECVKILLEKGADVDLKTSDTWAPALTALSIALAEQYSALEVESVGHTACVVLLREHADKMNNNKNDEEEALRTAFPPH